MQPFLVSWARDVAGESMDTLMDSCSQNTLKNERLEHWSYRQEKNLIDREKLRGETHSGVWKPGALERWSGVCVCVCVCVCLSFTLT
jgi:hypothetical protein